MGPRRGADLAPQHRVDRPSTPAHGARTAARATGRGDQRAEDGRSLTFTSAPLEEAIEILGFPEVELEIEVDRPSALAGRAAVRRRPRRRLAAHHARRAQPQPSRRPRRPAAAGARPALQVTIALDAIAQACPPGTACGCALSTRTGPGCGPPRAGDARAARRPPGAATRAPRDEELPAVRAAGVVGAAGGRAIAPGRTNRTHGARPGHRRARAALRVGRRRPSPAGRRRGIEMNDTHVTTYRIVDGDPLSASVRVRARSALGRGAWRTRVHTDAEMTATATEFVVRHRARRLRGRQADLLALVDARVPARRV